MKTDFVANASHELRTPIAAIKVAFETLRDVYRDDEPQTERCIQVIDGQLRRLEEMLRDLMDLSRVESQENRPRVSDGQNQPNCSAVCKAALGTLARQKTSIFASATRTRRPRRDSTPTPGCSIWS